MTNMMLIEVLELELDNLQLEFSSWQLKEQAETVLDDLSNLLDAKALLQHSILTHKFRLRVNERREPFVSMVVGLAVRSQRVLDFQFGNTSVGAIEQLVLNDRQRLVTACKDLPVQSALVAIEFAQQITSACLNLSAQEPPHDFEKRLKTLLNVKSRRLSGTVSDHPWQHELPAIAKYDWHSELLTVRAQLIRERRGFSLRLIKRESLPSRLQRATRIYMPERPRDLDVASSLDRAEHTRSLVNIVIRTGSRPYSDEVVVADFVSLVTTAARPAAKIEV